MQILQLEPPIPVIVVAGGDIVTGLRWPAGKGYAVAWIDYGQEHFTLWKVALDDGGEIWDIPQSHVRLQSNVSMGRRARVTAETIWTQGPPFASDERPRRRAEERPTHAPPLDPVELELQTRGMEKEGPSQVYDKMDLARAWCKRVDAPMPDSPSRGDIEVWASAERLRRKQDLERAVRDNCEPISFQAPESPKPPAEVPLSLDDIAAAKAWGKFVGRPDTAGESTSFMSPTTVVDFADLWRRYVAEVTPFPTHRELAEVEKEYLLASAWRRRRGMVVPIFISPSLLADWAEYERRELRLPGGTEQDSE